MLLFSFPICPVFSWFESLWQECVWLFFFFCLWRVLFSLDSLLVSSCCSLTSALFCISYDFGSSFWSFGKDVAGKKENWKKSMWSLYWCQSEINKNTSKDCGGSVFFLLGKRHLRALRKTKHISQHACSVGGQRIEKCIQMRYLK